MCDFTGLMPESGFSWTVLQSSSAYKKRPYEGLRIAWDTSCIHSLQRHSTIGFKAMSHTRQSWATLLRDKVACLSWQVVQLLTGRATNCLDRNTSPIDFRLFNFSGHFSAGQTLTFVSMWLRGFLSSKNRYWGWHISSAVTVWYNYIIFLCRL